MAATVIDGRAVAARVRARVADDVAAIVAAGGRRPALATILIGSDEDSARYVASKHRASDEAGIATVSHELGADVAQVEVEALIAGLNADPAVSAILLQLPVPAHLDGTHLTGLVAADKDVDGLTAESAGRLALGRDGLRPCTPLGVIELLAEAGARLDGAEAVVIGRSNLFGKPMAALLLAADATVTSCHTHTRDLAAVCRRADVLVVAAGSPGLVRGDWVKPGAVVIDVGLTYTADGPRGDVAFDEVAEVAGAITPVPGGVGPMTIAC
ncbi:MAG TPA: bifunctional 5,10-methylenetetrahydrofolate dehydrogenase/5,10-methenyltetrahydrofolate cyclohydrolase, partial [Solirubrobacteraceae bacterium]|nr:bifunctional 5,10-methylenetetrahydrofolate dehydrogenase/5,10-methenyltetrahydrofolate cyclohydrolase [Solirubrobacteraceae bacterium]